MKEIYSKIHSELGIDPKDLPSPIIWRMNSFIDADDATKTDMIIKVSDELVVLTGDIKSMDIDVSLSDSHFVGFSKFIDSYILSLKVIVRYGIDKGLVSEI